MPVQSFGMGIGGNPNLSRQSRRLYIGSITPDVNEQNLADFFNSKMIEMSIGTGGPGNPVLAVQCNYEKNYAFVEVCIFQNLLPCAHRLCSSAALRMQLRQWLLMVSFSLMDLLRFVGQKTMAESTCLRQVSMYPASFRLTSQIPSIKFLSGVSQHISTKSKSWNYSKVSEISRLSTLCEKMGTVLPR